MSEIKPGLRGEKTIIVTEAVTAKHVGSGSVRVFSTPSMVALMELTATELVQPLLPEGDSTVGVEVHLKHLAATPMGAAVTAKVVVENAAGRFIDFNAEIFDAKEKVGEGSHRRAIIHTARFLERVSRKSNKSTNAR
jgi:fluoroacetyl-CoA thioesterase